MAIASVVGLNADMCDNAAASVSAALAVRTSPYVFVGVTAQLLADYSWAVLYAGPHAARSACFDSQTRFAAEHLLRIQ